MVQDDHAVTAKTPSIMTTSSKMDLEEVQEDTIVREEYRKLEEDFSDIEEQEEDTSDMEGVNDSEDNDLC